MFDKLGTLGTSTISSGVLDDDDTEAVRAILIRRKFVRPYTSVIVNGTEIRTNDRGLSNTVALLETLTPNQRQWIRVWLNYWRGQGPGKVRVIGGADGVEYDQSLENSEPELEICAIVTGETAPLEDLEESGVFGFS